MHANMHNNFLKIFNAVFIKYAKKKKKCIGAEKTYLLLSNPIVIWYQIFCTLFVFNYFLKSNYCWILIPRGKNKYWTQNVFFELISSRLIIAECVPVPYKSCMRIIQKLTKYAHLLKIIDIRSKKEITFFTLE